MTAALSSDQLERIAEDLERRREDLERLAASGTAFAKRAQAALRRLVPFRYDSSSDDGTTARDGGIAPGRGGPRPGCEPWNTVQRSREPDYGPPRGWASIAKADTPIRNAERNARASRLVIGVASSETRIDEGSEAGRGPTRPRGDDTRTPVATCGGEPHDTPLPETVSL